MPPSALGEVLITLADAQVLSERLPPLSPDHETVALVVARMKVLHRELTGTNGRSILVVNHTRATVAQAQELLASARRKGSRREG